MSRKTQNLAPKGSQRGIQYVVNERPDILSRVVQQRCPELNTDRVEWMSPLKTDDYAEYSDGAFIERLGITLGKAPLADFWPKGGPVWDALGRTASGKVLLVEAKAHIPEIVSPATGATATSLKLIQSSLSKTKTYLGSQAKADWSASFYQYTNRLAHLYLLRVLNNVPAYLVFVYFINDKEMYGPTTEAEWKGAIDLLHSFLGIRRTRLSPYIIDVFIDTAVL